MLLAVDYYNNKAKIMRKITTHNLPTDTTFRIKTAETDCGSFANKPMWNGSYIHFNVAYIILLLTVRYSL